MSDVPPTLTAWRKLCADIKNICKENDSKAYAKVLAEITELAPRVDPEYRAVEALFKSGSGDALRIYHSVFGEGPLLARAGRSRSPLIIDAINSGYVDLLSAWLDLGMEINGYENNFIIACIEQDNPDLFALFLKTRGSSLPGWSVLRDLIHDPGPRLAEALSNAIMHNYGPGFFTAGRLRGAEIVGWKFYCVLVRHIIDMKLTGVNMDDSEQLSAPGRALLEKLGSKHGQLDLLSQEPDRVAMLCRPANQAFFQTKENERTP